MSLFQSKSAFHNDSERLLEGMLPETDKARLWSLPFLGLVEALDSGMGAERAVDADPNQAVLHDLTSVTHGLKQGSSNSEPISGTVCSTQYKLAPCFCPGMKSKHARKYGRGVTWQSFAIAGVIGKQTMGIGSRIVLLPGQRLMDTKLLIALHVGPMISVFSPPAIIIAVPRRCPLLLIVALHGASNHYDILLGLSPTVFNWLLFTFPLQMKHALYEQTL